MNKCKKCLYQPICNTYARLGVTDLPESDITPCELFKDKENYAEVKHGCWIKVGKTEGGSNILQCSACKKVRRGIAKTAYCKDCGTKMDGGKQNDFLKIEILDFL